MKTFEEQFTAWVDGTLPADQLARFEQELSAHPEAAADKKAALSLGKLLRESSAPALGNADFFAHQLRERIAQDAAPEPATEKRSWFRLPVFRFGALGAFGLLLALAFFKGTAPNSAPVAGSEPGYLAEIIDAHASDPSIYVSTIKGTGADGATVLWLDGLDYVPGDRKLVSDARR